MPKKTSPEIKERAPNQDITTIIGLGDMINQQSEKILSVLKRNYLGSENAWVKVGAMSKEIVERARRLNDIESDNGELVERLKREISRLRKENSDLKNKLVSNVTNITNNTSDSSNEVRVNKAFGEILVKILANTETIKQQNKDEAEWLESKEVKVYNKKDAMLSDEEVRAEIYRTQGEEALRAMMREKEYASSTIDRYIREIKKQM